MVYYRFCATCDGFVGFCGLVVVVVVEVSVAGWWVLWWQRLVEEKEERERERERERINRNAICFCWVFMVVVLWVAGGGRGL